MSILIFDAVFCSIEPRLSNALNIELKETAVENHQQALANKAADQAALLAERVEQSEKKAAAQAANKAERAENVAAKEADAVAHDQRLAQKTAENQAVHVAKEAAKATEKI